MPWVDENTCSGCWICVDACVAGAIVCNGDTARIDMDSCIRCGTCHSICPDNAVRHDSEKIPELVRQNLQLTLRNMDLCVQYLDGDCEREKCLERMKKHFNKQRVVAEKTLEELEGLKHE